MQGGGAVVWMWVWAGLGCKGVQALPDPGAGRPTTHVEELRIKRIDFERVDAIFVVTVDNPWPQKARVTPKAWSLSLAGAPVVERSGKAQWVAAAEPSEVRLPVTLRYDDAAAIVGTLGDDVAYELDATLAFDTAEGEVENVVQHRGTLPVLHAPHIEVRSMRLLAVNQTDLQLAQLEMELGLERGGASTELEAVSYQVRFDELVVARGRASRDDFGAAGLLSVPIQLSLVNIPAAISSDIQTMGALDIQFVATGRASTPHGSVPLAMDYRRVVPLR